MNSSDNPFNKVYEKHKRLYDIILVVLVISAVFAVAYIGRVFYIIFVESGKVHDPSYSEATALDSSCHSVYDGVRSGKINNTMRSCDGSLINWAADKYDSAFEKEGAARLVTLKQVQIYHGMDISLEDKYYAAEDAPSQDITKGQILFVSEENISQEGVILIPLGEDTTLGDLYE